MTTTLFGHAFNLTLISNDTIGFEVNGVRGKFVETTEDSGPNGECEIWWEVWVGNVMHDSLPSFEDALSNLPAIIFGYVVEDEDDEDNLDLEWEYEIIG